MNKEKVVIIGLDCAAPWLVFDLFKDDLPNLSRLMQEGIYGDLKSTHPPITVPAWMAMMTGKDTVLLQWPGILVLVVVMAVLFRVGRRP